VYNLPPLGLCGSGVPCRLKLGLFFAEEGTLGALSKSQIQHELAGRERREAWNEFFYASFL